MTTIEVHKDRGDSTRLVGQAHLTRSRGRVSTTFLYDTSWLSGGGMPIDPALPLVAGPQYQNGLVRAFADSAPDRWGRGLIEKAERVQARDESRASRRLDDVDFLLGVSDDTRQGALRFRLLGSDRFLGRPAHVPKLVSLPELLRATEEVSRDGDASDALQHLLDTGSTGLGGARPKASVLLPDSTLAIAKFPHSGDRWDVMAWEATALDLLEAAGISTPDRQLIRVGDRSVLVLRRFDRDRAGGRIGYISAMTATGSTDGQPKDYVDIAEGIRDLSISPRADLRQLFDRVVAGVALGNTDDHLRNHGFLEERGSWTLSPAFDVNPTPDPYRPRSTSVMGADTPPDEVDALLDFADECGLTTAQARDRTAHISGALYSWQSYAGQHGIPRREIEMMAESISLRLETVARLSA
jgi:serine/threonine-protein kinase HipA